MCGQQPREVPQAALLRHSNLFRVANNDFSTAIVSGDLPRDLHRSAFQRTQVSKLRPVRCKDDAAKRAVAIVLAKIQECGTGARRENPQNAPLNTGILTRVKCGVADGDASSLRNLDAVRAFVTIRSMALAQTIGHHGAQNNGCDSGQGQGCGFLSNHGNGQ